MTKPVQNYRIKTPIKSLTADSRQVTAGSLFLAYPGDKSDGRNYIADAIKNGASAVLWDSTDFEWNAEWAVENIGIKHLRLQAGNIANQYYKKPSEKLWTIGVTGTNGKTSITQWLSQCFDYLGKKTAVVGTLGNGFANALSETQNTTPDAILLQSMLADYLKQGAEVVALEVSSHGLHQGRVNGVHFDIAVLSNLSRDHLDYHSTFAEYAAAKRRLFDFSDLKMSVLNCDDEFGREIEEDLKHAVAPVITYGIEHGDVQATQLHFENTHFSFVALTPQGEATVKANLIGRFNVYNVLAVLATLLVSKVSLKDAVDAIAQIKSVAGRMQSLGGGALPLVIVDYAHSPDALEKVLTTLNEQKPIGAKLVCVFGCGGNRDAGKRELMGKIASDLADAIVVTSDNPRHENKRKIINEILQGTQGNYLIEQNRAKAISVGILAAKPGDIVLIAGKGHEKYQEIKGVKNYFNDVEQAEKALKAYAESLS
ncbi:MULTISPECIES: UDP-N-acetylmuramoyl-L-alanyl-D-glutamate--2,6-diaminopimelate ligase [Methylotenera]|uniref:UDP-N-acetylmuramoyl-L-alanyl-D-glutamate--2, 6-diaminopimelate ligase n=1 Tax=Methylotenera TaxID=359407 RepID=UPI00036813E3|nr:MULTISPECIES: UDP-N-acetylmuramoyl-L-alanyl-D-glutamate--2,6-diaminopimelate ligase [Methylotenera]